MLNFSPNPIMFNLGFWQIRWYGFFIALAFLAGVLALVSFGRKKSKQENEIYDLVFWLAIGGIIGARLYEVFILNWSYYQNNLDEIIKIWHGGLAIHGAIIGGVIALVAWLKIKEKKISGTRFLLWADLLVGVLPLCQAVGRWGNYFNQELYGAPTNLPWGIYIAPENRPLAFANDIYFHPTFFYESVLDLILFFILWRLSLKAKKPGLVLAGYLIGYGLIRFILEFVRIDSTGMILGLRLPQLVAGIMIISGLVLYLLLRKRKSDPAKG